MIQSHPVLSAAGLSDRGLVRTNNEDQWGMDAESGLFIVADGLGGHNSGEIASSIAVRTFMDLASQRRSTAAQAPGLSERRKLLEAWIKAANRAVYDRALASAKDAGMGTTVVAAWAGAEDLAYAHAGDSRLYLCREGRLERLTWDHSWAEDQVRRGLLSPEQARRPDVSSALTRAVGLQADVSVDVAGRALEPGDVLLLATDGLTNMVPDAEIERILGVYRLAAGEAARSLVERAKAAGGADNITVVVARMAGGRQP